MRVAAVLWVGLVGKQSSAGGNKTAKRADGSCGDKRDSIYPVCLSMKHVRFIYFSTAFPSKMKYARIQDREYRRSWVPFRRRKTAHHALLFAELYLSLLLGFVKRRKPVRSTHPEKQSIIPWYHGAYYLHYDDTSCYAKRSDKGMNL